MGLNIFHIKLSDISKINNLLLTTRIKQYNKDYSNKDLILSYFLDLKNKFTLGQLQKEDYNINGYYPIVDQSKDLIVGYTDRKDLVYTGILPIIVFGDHTRNFKYIDFPFVQGADGIKILTPDCTKINSKFLYYLLKKVSVPNRGYNRHYSILKKQKYPNISLDIQNKAIKQIEPLENDIHNLKSQKKEHLEIINDVFSEELKFDWDKFNKIKKEKVFISSLFQFSQNKDLRCGYKFHNKANQFLHNFLLSKTNKKVKDFIDEPIVLGKSISPSLYDEDGEYYYIAMSNIKNYRFDTKDCKKVGVNYFTDNKNKSIQQNDILLARSGEGTIGKVAIIEDDEIEGIFADFTMRIRLTNYNQLFAYYYFRSDFFQYLVYTHKKGLGNNTNIFPNQLQEFPLLDFTLEHQQQLVDKIKTKIDSQEDIDERIKNKQDEISLIIEDAIEGEKI